MYGIQGCIQVEFRLDACEANTLPNTITIYLNQIFYNIKLSTQSILCPSAYPQHYNLTHIPKKDEKRENILFHLYSHSKIYQYSLWYINKTKTEHNSQLTTSCPYFFYISELYFCKVSKVFLYHSISGAIDCLFQNKNKIPINSVYIIFCI